MSHRVITFVWQDMTNNTTSMMQYRATQRTIPEAWDAARKDLADIKGMKDAHFIEIEGRFAMIGAIEGAVMWMDDAEPLRPATEAEKVAILADARA